MDLKITALFFYDKANLELRELKITSSLDEYI
jgi:hypothetical protein